jgi:hypothetical protein
MEEDVGMNEENVSDGAGQIVMRRVLAGLAVGAGVVALSLVTMRSSLASPSTSDPAGASSVGPVASSTIPASHAQAPASTSVSAGAATAPAGQPAGAVGGSSPGTVSGSGTTPRSAAMPASPAVLVADNQTGGAASTPATAVGGTVAAPTTDVITTSQSKEWTWTTFPVKLSLKFENVYDDNIYIRHSNRVGDFYWVMIPSLEFKSRDLDEDLDELDPDPENYFHFDYKPEFDRFLDEKQNNFIDQHADGNYLFSGERLKLGLNGGFNTSHYPNVDFGGRLDAAYYTGSATWSYELTKRMTIGGDAGLTLTRYKQGINTDEYTTSAYLDYAIFPKTTIGLGSTLGYLEVAQFQPHQDYGQFYARASYQIREKVDVTGRVGVEYREYNGTGNASSTEPSFALGVNYQPFDSTTLRLEGARNAVPSIAQFGTNYYDTSVTVSWRQRLLQQVYFSLSGSYDNDDYYSVSNTTSTGLSFDYFTVRPSFEWDWNKYLKFNAYYEWQDNHSSAAFSGFSDNSVGIGANFSY